MHNLEKTAKCSLKNGQVMVESGVLTTIVSLVALGSLALLGTYLQNIVTTSSPIQVNRVAPLTSTNAGNTPINVTVNQVSQKNSNF